MGEVVLLPYAMPDYWLSKAEQHQHAADAEKACNGFTSRYRALNCAALNARAAASDMRFLGQVVAEANGSSRMVQPPGLRIGAAPTIGAELSEDGKTVSFHCPHCRRRHTHGADGIADGSTPHRLAHCTKADSPLHATGYFLVVVP